MASKISTTMDATMSAKDTMTTTMTKMPTKTYMSTNNTMTTMQSKSTKSTISTMNTKSTKSTISTMNTINTNKQNGSITNGNLSNLVRKDLKNQRRAENLDLNERIKQRIAAGEDIVHFAFGQSPFPIPKCLVDALAEYADRHEYLPMNGLQKLREALVSFHKDVDGLELRTEGLLVAPGSKELIYLTMVNFSGDIIIPAPSWLTYSPQCRLAGHEPVVIPTTYEGKWKVTPALLQAAVDNSCQEQYRLLILNNPMNPAGLCYTGEELAELSTVCRQNNIFVLSDEIYSLLTFSRQYSSMVTYYPEGTILTTGFSKWASAGGWRLGYAHFPAQMGELCEAVKKAGSHTYSCAPTPMQHAAAKALMENRDELKKCAADYSRILQTCGDYTYRELASVGVKGYRSEAGYYYVADFEVCREKLTKRGITTGSQMCAAILDEAKVALLATEVFMLPAEYLTTRYCFVGFDGIPALAALPAQPEGVLSDDFINKYIPVMTKGVQALKKWVVNNS